MEIVYKEVRCVYDEDKDRWETSSRDDKLDEVIAVSFKLLKKKIDKIKAGEFTRVSIITGASRWGSDSGLVFRTITSVRAGVYGGFSYWIVDGKGGREKRSYMGDVYLDTPDNRKRKDQWNAVLKEIRKLEKAQGDLLKEMALVDVKKLQENAL